MVNECIIIIIIIPLEHKLLIFIFTYLYELDVIKLGNMSIFLL